jgi:hypothetical protein
MPPRARTTSSPEDVEPGAAAEAAVAEVENDDIKFTWRGEDFTIARETMRSARVLMAVASDEAHTLLFEILGPVDSARFVKVCERNESLLTVAAEFFKEFGAAAGSGNS